MTPRERAAVPDAQIPESFESIEPVVPAPITEHTVTNRPAPPMLSPLQQARTKGITHEYNGNNHRLIVDGIEGPWVSYAAVAEHDNYRAHSDDRGEGVYKLNYLLDYNIIRDGALR